MKKLTLLRKEMGDQGTFGELSVDGVIFYTGELPWRDNVRGKSCVRPGTYIVSWQPSAKFGHKYHLLNVPGRSDILIHAANFVGDEDLGYQAQVDGCIALGFAQDALDGQKAVVQSRAAVRQFEDALKSLDFQLTIIDEYLETGEPASGNLG